MSKIVDRITPVNGDLANLLNKTFTSHYRSGYINLDGCILPKHYKHFADAIENFEVRDDDVWVCSFPRTGTTWTQEMVWCIANDLDFERSKICLQERFPCLELADMFEMDEVMRRNPEIKIPSDIYVDSVRYIERMPSPRFIKTHLHSNLLPRELRTGEKKPKIIYVVRNPKDTCISFYHFCKFIEGFKGSFEDFCTLFLGDTLSYGPFWNNVLGYWDKRNYHNMLILKYEDMKRDLPSVIKKTATFLGKSLTNDQVSQLNEHLSFSNMKNNSAVNYDKLIVAVHKMLDVEREGEFIRCGRSEQWKRDMTPEQIERFDEWINRHLEGTGLLL